MEVFNSLRRELSSFRSDLIELVEGAMDRPAEGADTLKKVGELACWNELFGQLSLISSFKV